MLEKCNFDSSTRCTPGLVRRTRQVLFLLCTLNTSRVTMMHGNASTGQVSALAKSCGWHARASVTGWRINVMKTLSVHIYSTPTRVFFCRPPYDIKLPRGPALFGISWDGGAASKRRSYTPIIVSCGNTDSASCDTCQCIGYMPVIRGDTDSDVRRILVQRCIGAVVKVINDSAESGFTCTLHARGSVAVLI